MSPPKDQHTQTAEAMLHRIIRVAELLAPYAGEETISVQNAPAKANANADEKSQQKHKS